MGVAAASGCPTEPFVATAAAAGAGRRVGPVVPWGWSSTADSSHVSGAVPASVAAASGATTATSFYVDCRLFRATAEEAEAARGTLGADGAPSGGPTGGIAGLAGVTGALSGGGAGRALPKAAAALGSLASLGAAAAKAAKGPVAALATVAGPGAAPAAAGEPDLQQQCTQLQGLFAKRSLKAAADDSQLLAGKAPRNLTGNEAPDGLFVLHSASQTWFKCFATSQDSTTELRCTPYEALDNAKCGWRRCNYHRQTFRTQCVQRLTGGPPECIYVGHFGQPQPPDLMGKPAPYAVYILGGPPPLAAAGLPGGAAMAAPARPAPGTGRRPWLRRREGFLAGPPAAAVSGGRACAA